jgi:hypothetical protein
MRHMSPFPADSHGPVKLELRRHSGFEGAGTRAMCIQDGRSPDTKIQAPTLSCLRSHVRILRIVAPCMTSKTSDLEVLIRISFGYEAS